MSMIQEKSISITSGRMGVSELPSSQIISRVFYRMNATPGSYEKMVEQHEDEKLTYYRERSNLEQESATEDRLFVNLSLTEILRGMSQTFIDIINEIVSGKIGSAKDLLITLFHGDRMIYTGVLLVLIAFAIYVVDITG